MARKTYTKKVKIVEATEEDAVVDQVAIKKTREEKVAVDVPTDYELLQKENDTLKGNIEMLNVELELSNDAAAQLENKIDLIRKSKVKLEEDREQEITLTNKIRLVNNLLFAIIIIFSTVYVYNHFI
jgi:predicted  nucleic acid-binding Zn-ribbon protein